MSTNTYTQGQSDSTVSAYKRRTAEVEAAFLLPHVRKTDNILDVGCGPGTITTGLAKYATEGSVIGIDLSREVIDSARRLAAVSDVPREGVGSVDFRVGNVLETLDHPDNFFDIVFASQVFYHLPLPDVPLQALSEIRRVLKPGGILATRDGMTQHFYPRRLDLDRLWVNHAERATLKGVPDMEPTAPSMPRLLRKAGFDVDGGKVRVQVGSSVTATAEGRRFLARRCTSQLQEGDAFRQSWIDVGISEEDINRTLAAVREWKQTEDAWHVVVQCEILAWK
nr:uncharacterized protein CI109_006740 [Kwoniella shandongensis]KAA5524940.1 hypothetical protein CI109_006740 [Kwoniella shandongensis]